MNKEPIYEPYIHKYLASRSHKTMTPKDIIISSTIASNNIVWLLMEVVIESDNSSRLVGLLVIILRGSSRSVISYS